MKPATAAGLTVRAAVALSGGAALLVAMPADYAGTWFWPIAAAALALCAAARPHSGAIGLNLIAAVLFWLTNTIVYGTPADPVSAVAIGALLYLHHSAGAMAAQLPASTDLPPRVLIAWAARAGAVLLGSAVLAVAVLAAPALPVVVAAPLGAAGAVGLVFLTRRLARRSPPAGPA